MKTIIAIITALAITSLAYAGEMTKQETFAHSVTENGKIQVRMVTEYLDDGVVVDKKVGEPMTPDKVDIDKDGKPIIPDSIVDEEGVVVPVEYENIGNLNVAGWDQESKDIVTAITDKDVEIAFAAEKEEPTGTGLETIVTYDRTVDDLGRISVRRITRIYDGGEIVSKKFHRSWIMPGDDASKADVMSKALADKIHTQPVIDAYDAEMAESSSIIEDK